MNTRIQLITLLAAASVSTAVYAQAMQIIGGVQTARDCYMSATLAAQTHTASKADVDVCSFALNNISLTARDRVATLVNRGIIYVALEQYDKAIKDYNRAYKINPNIAELHVSRGNLLFMSGHFNRAVKEYTRALKLGLSRQYIVYYNRGLTYEKLGETARAARDYRRALQLMPGWDLARDKLDRLLKGPRKTSG